jgi:hypothetical protein
LTLLKNVPPKNGTRFDLSQLNARSKLEASEIDPTYIKNSILPDKKKN